MPDIRPVSDLRNHFKSIEKAVHINGGPIFLTNKGRSSMVLLSDDKYEELLAATTGNSGPSKPMDKLPADALSKVEQISPSCFDGLDPAAKPAIFIGKILACYRTMADRSFEDIAAESGLAPEVLERIESGEIAPDTCDATIEKLASAYGVDVDILETFQGAAIQDSTKKLLAQCLIAIANK